MTRDKIQRCLLNARQYAAIATGFSLPFSTSGQAIAVSIFVALAVLTLDRDRFFDALRRPAGYLPVALFMLIVLGLLWSMQPVAVAAKWVIPYSKLLLIPLTMATAFTSKQGVQIAIGFLISCVCILAIASASFLWPTGPWSWFKAPGVPFKDNAVQSECFALCAYGLAIAATRIWTRHKQLAIAMIALALLFFGGVFMIYLSKTGMISTILLLALFIFYIGGWKRGMAAAAATGIIIAIALLMSAPAQRRLAEISKDIHAADAATGNETLSTAARMDFWTKAITFVKEAPLLGHGTGSIQPLYQEMEATRPSPLGEATRDPHNQTLHVVLQVGLVGGVLLWAMWIAHARMFLSRDTASVVGQAVVLQNVVGSLFNSHISQVTQGMLYCLAVGLLGALVCKPKHPATINSAPAGVSSSSD